jgi:hypothetical protein
VKIPKSTFQDEVSFRYDLFGGEILVRIVRELKKILPNVTNDQQSKAWIWRGLGVEKDPWYWVKVNSSEIVVFSGYFTGAQNWGKFRRDVRSCLLEALSGIETEFVGNLTASYAWVLPKADLKKKFPELVKFSNLAVPEGTDEPERFSTVLFNTKKKERVLFEFGPDATEEELRLGLSLQTGAIEKVSLANVFDEHFKSTDAAYTKANSLIESLFT